MSTATILNSTAKRKKELPDISPRKDSTSSRPFDHRTPQRAWKKGFFRKVSMVQIMILDFEWKLFGHCNKIKGLTDWLIP